MQILEQFEDEACGTERVSALSRKHWHCYTSEQEQQRVLETLLVSQLSISCLHFNETKIRFRDHILIVIKSVHSILFFMFHFNIILSQRCPGLRRSLFHQGFPTRNLCISLSRACHMVHPPHSPSSVPTLLAVQRLVMPFHAVRCRFLPLKSKYLPLLPVVEYPQRMSFP